MSKFIEKQVKTRQLKERVRRLQPLTKEELAAHDKEVKEMTEKFRKEAEVRMNALHTGRDHFCKGCSQLWYNCVCSHGDYED